MGRRARRILGTWLWALVVGALAFIWVFPLLWAFTTSLRPPGQIGNDIASLWLGGMVPYLASAFGRFLLRQTIRSSPRPLERVAVIDGSCTLRTTWDVFHSLTKPSLFAFSCVTVVYHYDALLCLLTISDTEW